MLGSDFGLDAVLRHLKNRSFRIVPKAIASVRDDPAATMTKTTMTKTTARSKPGRHRRTAWMRERRVGLRERVPRNGPGHKN
jgi:hypothetical protein